MGGRVDGGGVSGWVGGWVGWDFDCTGGATAVAEGVQQAIGGEVGVRTNGVGAPRGRPPAAWQPSWQAGSAGRLQGRPAGASLWQRAAAHRRGRRQGPACSCQRSSRTGWPRALPGRSSQSPAGKGGQAGNTNVERGGSRQQQHSLHKRKHIGSNLAVGCGMPPGAHTTLPGCEASTRRARPCRPALSAGATTACPPEQRRRTPRSARSRRW